MKETKDEIKIRRLKEQLEKNFRTDLESALNSLNAELYPLEEIIVEAARRYLNG